MGIPAFFRWISYKYPKIVVNCIEHTLYDENLGTFLPVDAAAPNPNGIEYDNLYLDMNGIIHPCSHPEDKPAPTSEAVIFDTIFDYIDRIFAIVRPRKLIYLAIDGVAPRAKINQQRSRRFRSSRENEQKMEVASKLLEQWDQIGLRVGGNKWKLDHSSSEDSSGQNQDVNADPADISYVTSPFDSNVITPGTPFMARLSIALSRFLRQRVKTSAAWKDITVIFSDASVPGEGEHKIAEFIRRERATQGYNPNLKHVMYGLDADLIMLALATHEVNFTIIREEVLFNKFEKNARVDLTSSQPPPAQQTNSDVPAAAKEPALSTQAALGGRKPFVFLHVHVLREYLDFEFRNDIQFEISASQNSNLVYDVERVIDDFILMCFFVGNDFLPHLPSLDIREGAIEFLIELYKTEVVRTGYLTSAEGNVDFKALRNLMIKTGDLEDQIFQSRSQQNHARKQWPVNDVQTKRSADELAKPNGSDPISEQSPAKQASLDASSVLPNKKQKLLDQTVELGRKPTGRIGTAEGRATATAALASSFRRRGSTSEHRPPETQSTHEVIDCEVNEAVSGTDRKESKQKENCSNDKDLSTTPEIKKTEAEFESALNDRLREMNSCEPVDNIRLNESGWKERYYSLKLGWGENQTVEKSKLLLKYIEGLQWVMKYYFVGCVSWGWHYPYHYAPFASDLADCDVTSDDIKLEIGEPFEPFVQLLAVMPSDTGKLVLPKCYADLMTDEKSPLIDYYPRDFEIDLEGKRFQWQGTALLPFVDEHRLLSAFASFRHLLTPEEQKRNSRGDCHLVVHQKTPLGQARCTHDASEKPKLEKIPKKVACGLLFGKASYPLPEYGGHTASVYTLIFELPKYAPHLSKILSSAIVPSAKVSGINKTGSRNRGWSKPWNGPLGLAARDLLSARQRRSQDRRRGSGHTEYHKYHERHAGNVNRTSGSRNTWDIPFSEVMAGASTSGNSNTWNNRSETWAYSGPQPDVQGNQSHVYNGGEYGGYSGYAYNGTGDGNWGNWDNYSNGQRRQRHLNNPHSWGHQGIYYGQQYQGNHQHHNAQSTQASYNYSNHHPNYANAQDYTHGNNGNAGMHSNSRNYSSANRGSQNTAGNDGRSRGQSRGRGGGLNGPTAASFRHMSQTNPSSSFHANNGRRDWS